ncbi:MAG: hypothetical protein KDC07_04155 [Chitinophagaceae bacterium]|nr:hypothetical protein [Chitinophagaceae bacterium]MCB9047269.1 hypothetical protein [Chitinophagales bacterium]
MKHLVIPVMIVMVFVACRKKDTYGYTCTCDDKSSGKTDTTYTIRVQTSGEASYICHDHADTANFYGKNIECNIK